MKMSCFTIFYLVIKCPIPLVSYTILYVSHSFAKNDECPSSSLIRLSLIVNNLIPVNVCTKECFFLCSIPHGWLLHDSRARTGWLPPFKSSVIPVSRCDSLMLKNISMCSAWSSTHFHILFCFTLSSFPLKFSPEKITYDSCMHDFHVTRIWASEGLDIHICSHCLENLEGHYISE